MWEYLLCHVAGSIRDNGSGAWYLVSILTVLITLLLVQGGTCCTVWGKPVEALELWSFALQFNVIKSSLSSRQTPASQVSFWSGTIYNIRVLDSMVSKILSSSGTVWPTTQGRMSLLSTFSGPRTDLGTAEDTNKQQPWTLPSRTDSLFGKVTIVYTKQSAGTQDTNYREEMWPLFWKESIRVPAMFRIM